MSPFHGNESFILLKWKLENVKNGKKWVGFEPGINWLQDWRLSLHDYPSVAGICMNLYSFWFIVFFVAWMVKFDKSCRYFMVMNNLFYSNQSLKMSKMEWSEWDSNQGTTDYKTDALACTAILVMLKNKWIFTQFHYFQWVI